MTGSTSGHDVNQERLRLLARHLGQQEMIERVDAFPLEKPDRIVARLASSVFPEEVDAVRIEVRLRYDGAFNCQYVEDWAGEQWTCRWDRHENPHSSRDHFHPPPTIDDQRAIDCSHPADLDDVVRGVLSFVERRVGDLWKTEDLVYPSEYEFDGEYGP